MKPFILISCIVILASCAPAANPNLMAAPPVAKSVRVGLSNAVCTRSVGGAQSNITQMSPINDSSFRAAIEQSLANNGLFARTASQCRYVVDANVLGVAVPTISGGTLPATANVNYSVFSKASGDPIYQATIVSRHEVRGGGVDMFTLNEMLYEGVMRKNLTQFVTGLIRS